MEWRRRSTAWSMCGARQTNASCRPVSRSCSRRPSAAAPAVITRHAALHSPRPTCARTRVRAVGPECATRRDARPQSLRSRDGLRLLSGRGVPRERQGDRDCPARSEDRAVVGNHCTGYEARIAAKRCSTQWTIMSRIISPEMPAVVATQPSSRNCIQQSGVALQVPPDNNRAQSRRDRDSQRNASLVQF